MSAEILRRDGMSRPYDYRSIKNRQQKSTDRTLRGLDTACAQQGRQTEFNGGEEPACQNMGKRD